MNADIVVLIGFCPCASGAGKGGRSIWPSKSKYCV